MVTKRNPAYTLTGRITNGQDEPLEGLIVRAYDQDPITMADPLGEEVLTDAGWRHKVSFTGGNIWTPEVWGDRGFCYVLLRGRDPPMGTNYSGFRRVRTKSRSLEWGFPSGKPPKACSVVDGRDSFRDTSVELIHVRTSRRRRRKDMSTATLTLPPTVMTNNGRDKVHWSKEVWDRIDMAVYNEAMRTQVASKFLPLRPVQPKTTTVPSDLVIVPSGPNNTGTLTVDEGATTRLFEIWIEFALTPQQMEHEMSDPGELGHSTAVTLATRAANFLSEAGDILALQGRDALTSNDLFFRPDNPDGLVRHRGEPADEGLLNERPNELLPPDQIITVKPVSTNPLRYGEKTFEAVAEGYSRLQGKGHYGPYALVLHTVPYADTYAPLENTLIMPADRIRPLVTAGFYGTGTLPVVTDDTGASSFRGLLVSLEGNSMDLVVGMDATTTFMQQDTDGAYRFRVLERSALRLKDISAVIRFKFLTNVAQT